MSNMIPFNLGHLDVMEFRDHEESVIDREMIPEVAQHPEGNCVTFLVDGRVLAIMGYVRQWKGVYQVFILPSKYIEQYPVTYIRSVKRQLKLIIEEFPNAHRVHTYSLADSKTDDWMKYLGFTCEGVLSKFTSNKIDYKMWSMVFEDTNG